MAKTAVVALGAGTIVRRGQQGTASEQQANLKATCAPLAGLVADGWQLVLTYGGGPQVGNIVLQNHHARSLVAPMPLDVCGAQSQGQIGYLLQIALENAFQTANVQRPVAAVPTRVLVDPTDPSTPESALGPIYPTTRAVDLMRVGVPMRQVERGWRQVAPLPQPQAVLELPLIQRLLQTGYIVIGGGGVPVVRTREGALQGVEAVVEKDLTASLLARELQADLLILLTDVPGVMLQNQGAARLTVADARRLRDQLPWQSMGVKVEAAALFAQERAQPALITDPDHLPQAMQGQGGTYIVTNVH